MAGRLYYKNTYITDENPDAGFPHGEFLKNDTIYKVDAKRVVESTTESGLIIKYKRIPYLIKKGVISKYEWSYEFTLEPIESAIYLSDIPDFNSEHAFSVQDFYGDNLDGENRKIEIRFIGYEGNRLYDPDGVYHPCSLETDAIAEKISPDGAVDYDSDLGLLTFANGSNSTRIYQIKKLTAGYIEPE